VNIPILVSCTAFAFAALSTVAFAAEESLRQRLLDVTTAVSAWQIEYEYVVPPGATDASVLHRIVAMKGPNSILHLSSKVGHGAGMSWKDDPLQQRSIISQNQSFWEFPLRRAFRLSQVDDKHLFPGTLSQDILWPAVMWWPITRESNHVFGETPYIVADTLSSPDFIFRDDMEVVNEIPCWVLESPGRSTLWFDSRRLGVLVAREFYSRETRRLRSRIELSRHIEIAPAIWCPMEFRNIQYDYNAPTARGRQRKVADATFQVLAARVNDQVAQDLFDIPAPNSGALQAFEDGTYKQIAPGGSDDYLDSIVAWVRRHVRNEREAWGHRDTAWSLSLSVASICCIYWCWRSRPFAK
jgi:hypothetical protein